MLDEDTRKRLKDHVKSGGASQRWGNNAWYDYPYSAGINMPLSFTYRAKPEPKTTVRWYGVGLMEHNGGASIGVAKRRCAPLLIDVYLRVERDEKGNILSLEMEKDA